MPTYSTATSDTTSSATSDRHFSKFEKKTAENADAAKIDGFAAPYPYAIFYENKSAHHTLDCPHFANFAICPGTLSLFGIKCNAGSRASSNLSSEQNIDSVFELNGVAFRLAPPSVGLLV